MREDRTALVPTSSDEPDIAIDWEIFKDTGLTAS
jgi:hypothetical protein